jgi:hypothetical protein
LPIIIQDNAVVFEDEEQDFIDFSKGIMIVGRVDGNTGRRVGREKHCSQMKQGARSEAAAVAEEKQRRFELETIMKRGSKVWETSLKRDAEARAAAKKAAEAERLKMEEEPKAQAAAEAQRLEDEQRQMPNGEGQAAAERAAAPEENRRLNDPEHKQVSTAAEDGKSRGLSKRRKVAVEEFAVKGTPDAPTRQSTRLRSLAKKELKPLFEVNDQVYAPWRPHRKAQPAWYPGIITEYKVVKTDGEYGPVHSYRVVFDEDNDEIEGIGEEFVFSREDYLLSISSADGNNGKAEWIGVKNVVDEKSSDTWAKVVGWYDACIGEFAFVFPYYVESAVDPTMHHFLTYACLRRKIVFLLETL